MGDDERSRSSRGRGRSRSRTRSKSRSRTQKSETRDAKRDKRSKNKRRSKRQREQIERKKPVGSFLQGYLDDAIATAATAMSIFDIDDDFESQMSDEFSFESSHSTGQGDKYSASDDSVEVAAVATEQERKIIQHQQPDIATFRLKRNGRPYAVKKLVKQLEREEQKRLKAALALEEAEERMWKTKWKLYNLAEELGLLCGDGNPNDVEYEDALYDTDSFNSFTDDR